MQPDEPETRATTVATYVLLFVLGVLQGIIGSFQYGQEPVPLIAIILIVVLFATCVLASWAMRSFAAGLLPAIGWMIASFVLSLGTAGGSVIITATAAGEWYLYGGVLACLAGIATSFASWARAISRPR